MQPANVNLSAPQAAQAVADRLVRHLNCAWLRCDESGRIIGLNGPCAQLLGVAADACLHEPVDALIDLNGQRLYDPSREARANLRATGWAIGVQNVSVRGNAAPPESASLKLCSFHSGSCAAVETTFVLEANGTDHMSSVDHAHFRFQTLTALAPVGILELDAHWACQYANDRWCELSQLTMAETEGDGWASAIHRSDVHSTLAEMHSAILRFRTFEKEVRLQTELGQIIWVSLCANGLYDSRGTVDGILIVATDVTERHHANESLRKAAHFDALTGLDNRGRFLETLPSMLRTARSPESTALLYLDLDGFKAVNDSLGHLAGDELLRQVADRLRGLIGQDQSVARLGGDEFTLLARGISTQKTADQLARRIIERLRSPFKLDNHTVSISCSIGVAVAAAGFTDEARLINDADTALFRAKQSGKNCHVFFSAELDDARRKRSKLLHRLQQAVEAGEFEIQYQPQVDITSQRIVGLEALLRWSPASDEQEPIGPDVFVPILEDAGLIDSVGLWVTKQACQDFRQLIDTQVIDTETRLSVNVSARQLRKDRFVADIQHALLTAGIKPVQLVLEVTESVLVNSFESGIIDALKELGVSISIDDFGTGFSSLAYLGQLPVDEVKIDRCFVQDIGNKPHARPIVAAILALANSLNLEVIAEGVEDAQTLAELKDLGCTTYQGFCFAKPMSSDSLARMSA